MTAIRLLTYATAEFDTQRRVMSQSALRAGFDGVFEMSPEDLKDTGFWHDNAGSLTQKRGGGFWLWKPYIILDRLRITKPGDVLVYCDAGRDSSYKFTRRPENLVRLLRTSGSGFLTGIKTPHHGPLGIWTKRDCLILMNADTVAMRAKPPIQATWSVWTNTPQAIAFLEQWLSYACDPRCLTDANNTLGPNHPGFIDHRHDQAISTLLTYKTGAPFVDLTKSGIYDLFRMRPNSRLGHVYLKRPQHADDILGGYPAWLALTLCQLGLRS